MRVTFVSSIEFEVQAQPASFFATQHFASEASEEASADSEQQAYELAEATTENMGLAQETSANIAGPELGVRVSKIGKISY